MNSIMSDRSSTATADHSSSYDSSSNSYTNTQQAGTKQAQAIEQLTEDVADLRHYEAQTSKRLRTRVNWLTGLLAATLVILGGGLVGVALNLRNEQAALQATQEDLADQLAIAAEAEANQQQLNRLEQQLQSLNQQAQAIVEQAKGLTEDATAIPPAQWADLQARLKSLEQSIQESVAGKVPAEPVSEQFEKIDKVLSDFRAMIGTLTQTDVDSETAAPETVDPAGEASMENETAE